MKKINAFYFSGTGNTKFVTNYLTEKLRVCFEVNEFDISVNADLHDKITQADIILIAFPIYGSAPPIPMRNFVLRYKNLFKGKTVAIAETQYFFSGDGAASLGRMLQKCGADVAYAEHFNMPNNIADGTVFKVCNGEQTQSIVNKAIIKMDLFSERIINGKRFKRGFGLLPHIIGYYGQRKWWRKSESEKRSKLKIDSKLCVACGVCVKNCPVGNLVIEDGIVKTNGNCVFCYRCINLCAHSAITLFGKAVVTKYNGVKVIK